MKRRNAKNKSIYKFQCPSCGTQFEAELMPELKIMKRIGFYINCIKCGKRISIIQ